MLRVRAFPHQPIIQGRVIERLLHRHAGHAIVGAFGHGTHGGLPANLAQPPHPVAQPHQVALIGQHPLLHRRINSGVGCGDPHMPLAERLIHGHRDPPA